MKIKIKSPEHNITLALPNGLVLNRLTAQIGTHYINKEIENKEKKFSPAELRMFFSAIKQCKKDFPDLNLVEVNSADGEYVLIRL